MSAQVVEKYKMGFESSGETYGYQVSSGTAAPQTVLYSSGSRALKIEHTATQTIVTLDTIDLTTNTNFQHCLLEFSHIVNIDPFTVASRTHVATIECKLASATTWNQVTSDKYDILSGSYSSEFEDFSSFSRVSYPSWQGGVVNNGSWKRERFNMWSAVGGASGPSRKLLIRFVLAARTSTTVPGANEGWYLDNIRVTASPQSLAIPVISMLKWPDATKYPNSRAARIETKITTPAMAGLNNDSLYIMYRYGHDDSIRYLHLNSLGNNKYSNYIPFEGYDTTVYYRVVARDATLNKNMNTYPSDVSQWEKFRFVRGYRDSIKVGNTELTSSNNYPFSVYARTRNQAYYDSATLAAAGIRPGAITKLQIKVTSTVTGSNRDRYIIKMHNVDGNYATTQISTGGSFYGDPMITVYDSALRITQNAGTVRTIRLQDTFYYAGSGLIIQTYTINSNTDPSAVSVECVPTTLTSKTVAVSGYSYRLDHDVFSSIFNSGDLYATRPNFIINKAKNMPLRRDAGISGFVEPSATVAASAGVPNTVKVWLKNFGSTPLNAVRIYYQVDDSTSKYFNWSGTLAPFDSASVTVSNNQYFTAGHHHLRAWVEDSLTIGGTRYRDHEPLNDSSYTRFVSCAGPMRGVRYVGGSNANYNTLEEFIYSASLCGVDSVLTVKLAGGIYTPHTFLAIPGASHTNYVQFEPVDPNDTVFFANPKANGTNVNYLANLQRAKYLRFKNIKFVSYSANTAYYATQYPVRMSINSTDIHFQNCDFREVKGTNTIENTVTLAHIYSGGADSLVVDNCTFYRATTGISAVGPAVDNLAKGIVLKNNFLTMQKNSAIEVRNQRGAVVEHNNVDQVTTNASYVLLFRDCYGPTRIVRNTVYSTTGASCLGATNLHGDSATASRTYAVVANNMLVSNDNGTSNMLTTALNIIRGSFVKVVYNSVKLTGPTRNGIAAATLGGDTIYDCYFYNNIVTCYDTSNFAFNFIPYSGGVNYIGYNIYYSRSPLLNKYNGIGCPTLATWQAQYVYDTASQQITPGFIGSTQTDLRSYSQNVKGKGLPIAEVTNDINDTVRHATHPCVGAFEFHSLPYDFEIAGLVTPYAEYCGGNGSDVLKVIIKNTGVNALTSTATSGLTLHYVRGLNPAVGSVTNVPISCVIPATDTVEYTTSATLTFPPYGRQDTTYYYTMWLTSGGVDPNPANDTVQTQVTIRFKAEAPDSINMSVAYAHSATVPVTNGVDEWYPEIFNTMAVPSARVHKSQVYWYRDSASSQPIHIGDTLVTGILYSDTTLYIRQKRDLPVVKITQVQFNKTGAGATYPMPFYMNSAVAFAVELTNVGDYPVNLAGDTLMTIASSSAVSLNNKIFVLPAVTLQPAATLLVQFRSSIGTVDSSVTLGTPGITLAPANNAGFAVLYRDGRGIADAVPFNGYETQPTWTAQAVRSSVWTGPSIQMPTNSAGVYRKGWPTSATSTPSYFSQYWQTADSVHSMHIGTLDPKLMLFVDNGCVGDVSPVHINVVSRPNVDLAINDMELPTEHCSLGVTPVNATIRNSGSTASTAFNVYLAVNDSVICTDSMASIASNATARHTFSVPIDFTVSSGSREFNVKAWVDQVTGDIIPNNDTTRSVVISTYTPAAPLVNPIDSVSYASRITLQSLATTNDSLIWYDHGMNPVDTGSVFLTPYIYGTDSFYVAAASIANASLHIGTLQSTTSVAAYPSPYNVTKKNVKEQYVITANELIAAGHGAGAISSVSFYLDTLAAQDSSVTFNTFTISMGTMENATFGNNTDWAQVTDVYNSTNFTLTRSHEGWQTQRLQTPYEWDGVSNLVIQVCHTLTSVQSRGLKTKYTDTEGQTVLYYNIDNISDILGYSGTGSRSSRRPDIKIGFADIACIGPTSKIKVVVKDAPMADAAISFPASDSTATSALNSCSANDIDVVVFNSGIQKFAGYTIDYWVDDVHQGSVTVNDSLPVHADTTITVASITYLPGVHNLKAVVTLAGDTVPLNDTATSAVTVRFCAGTYTIGHSANNDYASFGEALSTLDVAGIAGSVVFSVESGTYNEKVNIGHVDGVSPTHTITFRSATSVASNVIITSSTTQAENYVVSIDQASDVILEHLTIFANPASGNFGNAVKVSNSSNIHFNYDSIVVKSSINNANASCIVIENGTQSMFVKGCKLYYGYYGIVASGSNDGLSGGVFIENNTLRFYNYGGIYTRGMYGVSIRDNDLFSSVPSGSKAQVGIFVAEHNGPATIERNNVKMLDRSGGAKRGIMLTSVTGSNTQRSLVSNNMVSCHSNGLGGFSPAGGILVDSSSHVNVYFNSVLMYAGSSDPARKTRAFSVDHNSTNIHVMNNILYNQSGGYALYAMSLANLGTVNYNVYYSDTVGHSASPRLGYVGMEDSTFAMLVATTGQDNNSLWDMPYFVSDTNLHLSFAQFNNKAQYNTLVPNDIDLEIRPQIPAPCIGADEPQQPLHDVTVMEIIEPGLSFDRVPTDNIESLPLRVVVIIYNNGSSVESGLTWDAQVVGTSPLCKSVLKPITEIQSGERYYDTVIINMPIGVIDTQVVKAEVYFPYDMSPDNNKKYKRFFLDPAYNIKADSVFFDDMTSGVKGCRLHYMPVSVKITNVGRLDIPTSWPIQFGFDARVVTGGVTVPQFPVSQTEPVTLSEALPRLASTVINLNNRANVYPTGADKDLAIKIRAFVTHQHDQKPLNDTTPYRNFVSKYTPHAPVGINLNIPYGTWDTIFASQTDHPVGGADVHLPINWYRDSTASPFRTFTSYVPSTWWETPQYYFDSVYYLSCISATGCTSYYRPVNVHLNSRVNKDAAAQWVEEPYSQVYMDDDTVKVRVFNYGTQTITNIPAVYQLKSNSGVLLQEVHEDFNVSIAPDGSAILAFDSLLQLATYNQQVYKLRVWADMPDDQTRENDTIRRYFDFTRLPENTYVVPTVSNISGFDITHVAFAGLNSYVSPSGHTYVDLAQRGNPGYPALHLVKGTMDTLVIEGENVNNSNDTSTAAGVTVFIDFNKDGAFTPVECILFDTLKSRHAIKFPFTYPYQLPASFVFDTTVYTDTTFESRRPALGYVRMRVIADQEKFQPMFDSESAVQFGSVHDYLLYIEDQPLDVDLAASRIVSPVDRIISTHDSVSTVVTFMMANKGAGAVTSANIVYTFTDDSNSVTDTLHWTGSVGRGMSVPVALPAHRFIKGTTSVRIIVKASGDANLANDTLYYDYHRFHVIELMYLDNFEYATPNLWYAPQGYTPYSKNLWQRGKVNKTNIVVAHSDSCVLATDTVEFLNLARTGNVSVIYTPIIDIAQVRPDTVQLWLAGDMGDSTYVKLQYLNYLDQWVDLRPGILDTMTTWYNSGNGFTGRTSGYSYNNYKISTSSFAGNFQQKLQFRILFIAHPGCGTGDGVVIDDFKIGRAQRAIDVGVTDIIYPTAPRFGETIYPQVVITNFGYDTIHRVTLAYDVFGLNLPKVGVYVSDTGISPNGGAALFKFPDPFIVKSNFPDTFEIAAYTTVNSDIYWNNDSTVHEFNLTPLDNDLGMVTFASPMDHIVAGDSIVVTTRVRNFGQAPVPNTVLTYVFNNVDTVQESVDFEAVLGRPLRTFEYYNYTFHTKKRASMGTMYLKAYTAMPNDDYLFNDTISKTLSGLASIIDLQAREIVLDSSDFQVWKALLVIDNVGAIATNNFEVGYWYDNDPSTLVVERHDNGMPLAALASAYHTFADTLQPRPAGYNFITAYVHVPNDNDPSNDTTRVIVDQYRDPYPVMVYVEENRTDSCHVRVMVKNAGNATFNKAINMKVTINGETLQHVFRDREVAPGPMYSFDMPGTISKSPTRTYEGEARFVQKPSTDRVGENNQTTWIEVRNYLDTDAIPSAESLVTMRLEQNRPNPFMDITHIDFYIPESGNVTFYVMDVMGRIVHRETRYFAPGDNTIDYRADRLTTGTYYYGIEKGGQRLMRKMIFKR